MAKRSPFLPYKELIRKISKCEGGLAPYRILYQQVKGTEAEAIFWDLLHWRAHAEEMKTLSTTLSVLLQRAAKERESAFSTVTPLFSRSR